MKDLNDTIRNSRFMKSANSAHILAFDSSLLNCSYTNDNSVLNSLDNMLNSCHLIKNNLINETELSAFHLNNNNNNSFYYYHNCVIDVVLKLFAKTIYDKYALLKLLIEDYTPHNQDLVKIFIATSIKLNGLHSTLQYLYDHLTVNSIHDEHLWVL
jgi:hypothetical protein